MSNQIKYKNMKTNLQHHTQGLFTGKLPVTHPAVQMMINERIIKLEQLEKELYHKTEPQRKAYYAEKLQNMTMRLIHHIGLRKRDKKDSNARINLEALQGELLILINHKPEWAITYGLTPELANRLMQDYK